MIRGLKKMRERVFLMARSDRCAPSFGLSPANPPRGGRVEIDRIDNRLGGLVTKFAERGPS